MGLTVYLDMFSKTFRTNISVSIIVKITSSPWNGRYVDCEHLKIKNLNYWIRKLIVNNTSYMY